MTHVHLPLTPSWLLWPLPWVWALLLLLALPALWLLWRRRRPAILYSDLKSLRAVTTPWPRRIYLTLPILRTVALGCLVVAAARPQRPDESSQIYAQGIAIEMVVDRSSSMSDNDLSPPDREMTRLDVVKDVFYRFVAGDGTLPGRPNDLIGMIRFALYPDSVCPLTLDHHALLDILSETYINRRPDEDMTAIGDALALAVERLKDVKRTSGSGQQYTITSRVIILLTDGENNAGIITPQQAGELAATYGIKVYTILAGTGRRTGLFREPVDDRDLRRIAEVAGGQHFRAGDREALIRIYQEIDRLERTKTEERRFVRMGELARPWLLTAFACLCVQMFLDATRLRKIP